MEQQPDTKQKLISSSITDIVEAKATFEQKEDDKTDKADMKKKDDMDEREQQIVEKNEEIVD